MSMLRVQIGKADDADENASRKGWMVASLLQSASHQKVVVVFEVESQGSGG